MIVIEKAPSDALIAAAIRSIGQKVTPHSALKRSGAAFRTLMRLEFGCWSTSPIHAMTRIALVDRWFIEFDRNGAYRLTPIGYAEQQNVRTGGRSSPPK